MGRQLSTAREGPTDAGEPPARLFYDGDCGFCHWLVRFVVARDRRGRFRFAPIGGVTFEEHVAPRLEPPRPDTVIVLDADGRLRIRSDAAIDVLCSLDPPWPLWGRFLGFLPKPLRDLGYRLVAAIRRRLTRQPESSCPMLPPDQRARFDP